MNAGTIQVLYMHHACIIHESNIYQAEGARCEAVVIDPSKHRHGRLANCVHLAMMQVPTCTQLLCLQLKACDCSYPYTT